ncbi:MULTISPECIES: LD-carboxypeptidase [unclassified Moraxella]|uniref:LD-carboxypeptidase n=1 Tax=unclassified Moraxella TaxID=2685852 RepID=UPI003AF5BFE6
MPTSLSRRGLLKSSLALTALATLNSRADLSIGGQTISQPPMTTGDSFGEVTGNSTGEASWGEPSVPTFDFATIKANCEALNGRGVPVHLLAPSGFGSDEQRNLLAIHRLTQAGFYIYNPEVISRRYLRFAGSDAERLGDITALLHQPVADLPKILLGVRGGYGAMRLLNRLSDSQWYTLTQKLKQRGTLLMGFSDFTAVQLAMFAQGGLPYVAGCMLGSDFGKATVNRDTIQSFINLCQQNQLTIQIPETQNYGIKPRLTGKLWGGNLSVLSAMVGSPYMPKVDNGILFLEDTGEQPYRIERMLQTLSLSGVLAKQQAIVLGKFNFSGISDAYNGDYTFDTVLRAIHEATRLPIYTDFPFGHVARRINVPLGVPVTLEAIGNGYQATFNEFYNLKNEKNFGNLDFSKLLM